MSDAPSTRADQDSSADTPDERLFRTTHWSQVLAAGDQNSAQGHEALARLCHTYWVPVYAFVRRYGYSPDQTKDLTQDFFAAFLEKNSVARAVRERGRFRSFLMTSVANFLHDAHSRSIAQKRGGGRPVLSLDDKDAEASYLAHTADDLDPAKLFELRWALTVLDHVTEQLREDYLKLGRAELFDALQAHLWGDTESVPYPQLAEKLQMTVANLKITAHRLRQSYRTKLREEIAHTVSQPGEVDHEVRYLMKVLSQ
ncbi:MAG TPA: hypothetical protein VL361_11390 [Candidatus Limnocylindrales bacterium]|jgi:RNA polymerase sigma-70 factor (ECF subfamily)|nr:hypothetical protein [Candidatus Limnocylindrales bacterium]